MNNWALNRAGRDKWDWGAELNGIYRIGRINKIRSAD